jgi:hypothetical protein
MHIPLSVLEWRVDPIIRVPERALARHVWAAVGLPVDRSERST